jgi:hypothetical protein
MRMKMMNRIALALLLAIAFTGCSKQQPKQMTEEEFLNRYGNVPLLPDDMVRMIDDRNRERGTEDKTDNSQAFLTDLTEGSTSLMIVKQLDGGNVVTARNMLLTRIKLVVSFLPVYQKRTKIDAKTLADAKTFARDVLDYLIAHKDELDPRFLDLQWALAGLAQLFDDDPVQSQRLLGLVDELAKKKKEAKPAHAGDGSTRLTPKSAEEEPNNPH